MTSLLISGGSPVLYVVLPSSGGILAMTRSQISGSSPVSQIDILWRYPGNDEIVDVWQLTCN